MKSINPANGEILKEYKTENTKEVIAKLELAEKGFKLWKQTSFDQRAELLLNCVAILKDKKAHLSQLMHEEMGKVISECEAEVEKCGWVCEYYAENAAVFLKTQKLPVEGKDVDVLFLPLGAVLAIMPWNFPFWQVFRFAAPSIMAGNVGVLKHAPNVSGCALAIENIFKLAGAPQGVFQTLLIDNYETESVIANPIIKAVTLTGSERAGSAVAAIAGKYIKKTVLELGGSDPFIVLEGADIGLAVKTAVVSRMRNAGQSCIAAKRFIVVDELHDEFVKQFTLFVKALKKEVDYGPMARIELAEQLERQMNKSIEMGANLVCGGIRDNAYFEPTILTDIAYGMPAYHEELFGPVAAIIKVKNIEQAIAIANDTNFGLGASVWTNDTVLAKRIALELEVGAVFINQMVASDPRIPFGGIKNSGYGRELGLWGIHEFVNVKPIIC